MNFKELNKRLDILQDVFAYTLLNGGLNVGQRICLSQERAAILVCIETLNYDLTERITPSYQLPDHLENKVQVILKKIEETDWVKPEYEKF